MLVYSDQNLTRTQEFFFKQKPTMQRNLIIAIIVSIVVTLAWFVFAPFEEVIRCSGYIRPRSNISTLSNAVTGRIIKVDYNPGKAVKKGDLLLSIDPTQILKEKESVATELSEQEKRLQGLKYINESIAQGRNLIPAEYKEADLRFKKWQEDIRQLEKTKNYNLQILNEEKNLPVNMTTEARLRDYSYRYNSALNEYTALNTSFRHDVTQEIEVLEKNIKLNKTKLEQIEDSLKYTDVIAPIDGIIQEISALNPGDWIQSGQKLFNIVPCGNKDCIVELSVPATQAGRLTEESEVKLRFPSLPYYEYGGAKGRILTIDPDISATSNGTAVFVVRTDMDKNTMNGKSGKNFPLRIGLQTDARIIVSKRTLLGYVLEKLNLWY
ncbi:MAG: HlyD family efflux transporter periplasmic adaptor subunit [Treponema sp.]|nr:HlyD family efflux transporter periplasmic adaptor subunit [Treponema sp.]